LIGAVRLDGWVTLGTQWKAVRARDFVAWVRDRLAPRLRPGDIVLLDNLRAHKAPAVADLIARRGATLKFLPPYSHDFNPMKPCGRSSRSIFGASRHAPPTRCAERLAPLATPSPPIIASGSSLAPGTSHQPRSGV
jgi:hypothetical protein